MSSESSSTLVSSLNITLPSSLSPASVTLKFTQEVVATLCCLHSLETFFFFPEDVTPGCQLCSKSCFGNPASSGGVCCHYRNSTLAEMPAWFFFSLKMRTKIEPLHAGAGRRGHRTAKTCVHSRAHSHTHTHTLNLTRSIS